MSLNKDKIPRKIPPKQDSETIGKKRGRKPKGGKIINQQNIQETEKVVGKEGSVIKAVRKLANQWGYRNHINLHVFIRRKEKPDSYTPSDFFITFLIFLLLFPFSMLVAPAILTITSSMF